MARNPVLQSVIKQQIAAGALPAGTHKTREVKLNEERSACCDATYLHEAGFALVLAAAWVARHQVWFVRPVVCERLKIAGAAPSSSIATVARRLCLKAASRFWNGADALAAQEKRGPQHP